MKTTNETEALWMDLVIQGGNPLTRQERDKINKYINIHSGPGCPVSYAMLDGFLTAIVIGPATASRGQNQGLELIWGETKTAVSLNTRSVKSRQQMMHALGRHAGYMLNLIQTRRDEYQPYGCYETYRLPYYDDEDDGYDDDEDEDLDSISQLYTPSVVEWCQGFMKYVALTADAWAPIFKTESTRACIAPFIYYGTDQGWKVQKALGSGLHPYRSIFARNMKYFIFEISDFFRPPSWKLEMDVLMQLVAPQWTSPTSVKQLK